MSTSSSAYLDLIAACDNFSYSQDAASEYYLLFLAGDDRAHGYMHPTIVEKMPWHDGFLVDHTARTVRTSSSLCSTAFQKLVDAIIDQNIFDTVGGRHSEYFSVPGALQPVQIERFAVGLFGTTARGAHLTAYTTNDNGDMMIWVPRRSSAVKTYPGMLDTTVAGGVRAHESPFETIVHEADEEASIAESLVRRDAKSCGVLTYIHQTGHTFFAEQGLVVPDMVHVYDLELEPGVVPTPKDDEVKEFYFMSVSDVQAKLKAGAFKPNSAVVMIDFFVRHGIINPDNEEHFIDICMRMHRRLPFPVSKRR
ncbi:NUDIX hydrolase domain-like protein [Paraphoma chrysanthemicola]|nr:NUDIX hydrolase domain-like protein [Paraphoma chrysanthemicola]